MASISFQYFVMAQSSISPISVPGVVSDPDGKAIPSAVVRYLRRPQRIKVPGSANPFDTMLDPSGLGVSGTTPVAADGTFSFGATLAGLYSVCAGFPDGSFLDTCKWGQQAERYISPAAGAVSTIQIVAQPAAMVTVHVSDPGKLLPAIITPFAPPNLVIGVFTSEGWYYAASLAARSATSLDLTLAVPVSTSLKLHVFSRQYLLALGDGAALDNLDTEIPFVTGSAGAASAFVIQITGLAQ